MAWFAYNLNSFFRVQSTTRPLKISPFLFFSSEIIISVPPNGGVNSVQGRYSDAILTSHQHRTWAKLHCLRFTETSRNGFHVPEVDVVDQLPMKISPFRSLSHEPQETGRHPRQLWTWNSVWQLLLARHVRLGSSDHGYSKEVGDYSSRAPPIPFRNVGGIKGTVFFSYYRHGELYRSWVQPLPKITLINYGERHSRCHWDPEFSFTE